MHSWSTLFSLFSIAVVTCSSSLPTPCKSDDSCDSSAEDDVESLLQTKSVLAPAKTSAKAAAAPRPHRNVLHRHLHNILHRRHRSVQPRTLNLGDDKYHVVELTSRVGQMQRIVSKVWSGEDLRMEEQNLLSKAIESSHVRYGHKVETRKKEKRIHLLGPPDSGTHLLVSSLQMNWPGKTQHACESQSVCDVSLWKHSMGPENDIFEHMEGCGNNLCTNKQKTNMSEAVVVIMVRSPISQMASWKKAPYSLKPCFHREWNELDEPCWSNTSPLCHDVVEGCKPWMHVPESIEFDSSVDVYNRYLEEYLELKADKRIGDVILVPYEDLVYTPDVELSKIARAMGWEIPGEFRILGSKAKTDHSRDRQQALDHLKGRKWLEDAGQKNLVTICGLLNVTALSGISEGTHTTSPQPYSQDCEDQLAASFPQFDIKVKTTTKA